MAWTGQVNYVMRHWTKSWEAHLKSHRNHKQLLVEKPTLDAMSRVLKVLLLQCWLGVVRGCKWKSVHYQYSFCIPLQMLNSTLSSVSPSFKELLFGKQYTYVICFILLSIVCLSYSASILSCSLSDAIADIIWINKWVDCVNWDTFGHFNFWLSLSLSDSLSETLSWTLKSGLRPKFNLTSV